jgi:diadenosine tetraphosphatase ApaH/serine/threonine PP2A family protein phosphatase
VRGNHDRRVAEDVSDEMWPSDRFARERLTPARRDVLAGLPLQLEIAPSVLAFHARPDHDERYLADAIVDGHLVRAPLIAIEKRLGNLDPAFPLLLCGHSHRPDLLRLADGRVIFNPGSVGEPPTSTTLNRHMFRSRLHRTHAMVGSRLRLVARRISSFLPSHMTGKVQRDRPNWWARPAGPMHFARASRRAEAELKELLVSTSSVSVVQILAGTKCP